jgi:hypothetical protein
MQIVPVVVVLGAVSWVVCAVSLEGEADSHLVWRGRLGAVAVRATSRIGAWRVEFPAARRAVLRRASHAARATAVHASEVRRGLMDAAVAGREGVQEDSRALSDRAQAAWLRAWPILSPYAALAVRTVEPRVEAAGKGLARLGRAALRRARSARSPGTRERRARRVAFRESLSMTGVDWTTDRGFPLAGSADEQGHRLRGALALILLVALIGAVIAAGLIGFGWGVKHLILRGRA